MFKEIPKVGGQYIFFLLQVFLRGGCPTIRPSNLYLRSSNAGNLLCMQLINKELGGMVERKDVREDGLFEIQVETECPLFKGLETRQMVLLNNGDSVDKVSHWRNASSSVSITSGARSNVIRSCSCCTSTGDNSSRVQGIYIDNGFLRKDESEQVVASL
ncbi:hypothetical protein OUZ56_002235 [Daphnia magna]|uniref:GMP synthase n=1 Tax=Daphnia magna TaxID=35525 RepID=A0ABR0A517_9CRUS|nr:hypothetical protein OUZ56_002235 [Daphnia magna]